MTFDGFNTIEGLTAVLVIITAFYAWATFKILKANERVVDVMREQLEALHRPYVQIAAALIPNSSLFYLRITNTGKSPAEDLKLELDKTFYAFGQATEDNNLRGFAAFKETIPMFAPGAELLFHLSTAAHIYSQVANANTTPRVFTVTAVYSFAGKRVTEKNTVDLGPYENSMMPRQPLGKELKEIKESIEAIAASINQFRR